MTTPPRLFKWRDTYVMAESREAAAAELERMYVDDAENPIGIYSLAEYAEMYSGQVVGDHWISVDPLEYLHAVPPDLDLEIPAMEISNGILTEIGIAAHVGVSNIMIRNSVWYWCKILPAGWSWCTEELG